MGDPGAFERGVRYYNGKRYEQALRELLSIDGPPGEDAAVAYYKGLALAKLGRYEDALIPLEQVVGSSDNLLHVYQSRMILAFIYAVTRRYRLAEYELRKLLEAGMESVQLHGSMGSILYLMDRVDDAVTHLLRALELNADYPGALNTLGYIYAERGQAERAVDLCRKATRLAPRNAAYLDSLGWALHKSGALQEARATLRKALDLAPGNPEIAGHMRTVLETRSESDRRR